MRKLASVRQVSALLPIEGADFIEMAQVDLWTCVVKKGEFQEGDLCVYFEIDSFLPGTDDRYKFLEKEFRTFEGKTGARLKTKRFKGQLSQGLALPLSSFPEVSQELDLDVTEILGITKWEPPVSGSLKSGLAKGNFPSFIRKTDQERIQNLWRNYEREMEANTTFEVTDKYDGSSMTVYFKDGEYGVCSRNLDLKESEGNSYWAQARKLNVIEALTKLGRNLAIQGELYGEGIQKNPKRIIGHDFAIFAIYDIDNQRYLSVGERGDVVVDLQRLGMNALPVRLICYTTLNRFPTFESLQDAILADPKTDEGWVFVRLDGQFSFKVISNNYLLKTGN